MPASPRPTWGVASRRAEAKVSEAAMISEDVLKIEVIRAAETTGSTARCPSLSCAAIMSCPSAGIDQSFIGQTYAPEPLSRLGGLPRDVGVAIFGECTEGPLDLSIAGVGGDPEYNVRVMISSLGHGSDIVVRRHFSTLYTHPNSSGIDASINGAIC